MTVFDSLLQLWVPILFYWDLQKNLPRNFDSTSWASNKFYVREKCSATVRNIKYTSIHLVTLENVKVGRIGGRDGTCLLKSVSIELICLYFCHSAFQNVLHSLHIFFCNTLNSVEGLDSRNYIDIMVTNCRLYFYLNDGARASEFPIWEASPRWTSFE